MSEMNVLFLCTANSSRSQMAEAFLRKQGGDKFRAFSAGLEPKGIHPLTIKVMEEIGISMEGHFAKPFSDYLGKERFAYLITVCAKAEENCPKAFPGVALRIHWPFDDPVEAEGTEEEKLQKFRQVRDEIEKKIKEWVSDPPVLMKT
jgi:arsenate reductase